MELNEKLKEARFIKRGEKWPEELTESCSMPCNWVCVKNNGTPNSYYYCTKLGIRVEDCDSCKYYTSVLDDVDFSPFIRDNYFNTSIEELIKQAKENNKFAAYELGRRYKQSKDTQQALKYFTLSANLGDTDAPLEAALILNEQERYEEAIPFLEMSIKRADEPRAHTLLGKYYAKRRIKCAMTKRHTICAEHYLAAAKKGDPEAQYLLAMNLSHHSTNMQEYCFWMRCAMLNGNQDAILFVNYLYNQAQNSNWERNWYIQVMDQDAEIAKHPEYIAEYYRRKRKMK